MYNYNLAKEYALYHISEAVVLVITFPILVVLETLRLIGRCIECYRKKRLEIKPTEVVPHIPNVEVQTKPALPPPPIVIDLRQVHEYPSVQEVKHLELGDSHGKQIGALLPPPEA